MSETPSNRLLIQSLMGGLAFILIAAAGWFVGHDIIVIPLAASIFIAFASPKSNSARPFCVIAGYFAGAASGLLAHWLLSLSPVSWPVLAWLAGGIAALLSILLMALLRAEHPPAAAFAVTLLLVGFDRNYLMTVLSGVVALVLISWLLRRQLVNLF